MGRGGHGQRQLQRAVQRLELRLEDGHTLLVGDLVADNILGSGGVDFLWRRRQAGRLAEEALHFRAGLLDLGGGLKQHLCALPFLCVCKRP